MDAAVMTDVVPHACAAATVCDGDLVRACHDGKVGEVLSGCPDMTCSRGRCASRACATIEENLTTFEGCLFYTTDIDNVISDESLPSSLLVTNPGLTVATVELQQRTGGAWTAVTPLAVPAFQSGRLTVPARPFTGGGYASATALRLTSDAPVTVAHIESDDGGGAASSTGGTIVLPAQALGRHYMVMTYPQKKTPKVTQTAGSRGGAGRVILVGTADNTAVTFTVSAHASLGLEGGAPARGPGESFTLTLQDGDTYQILSTNEGDDLSGSQVSADRAVAVFSGNLSTSYGLAAAGINSPDLTNEQMLPDAEWPRAYVAASLPPQAGTCDATFALPDASLWRILAARDETTVQFDVPPGVTGLPAGDITLAHGEPQEWLVNGGSFGVRASGPILLTQGVDCEPTLSAAVAAAPLLSDLSFAVLPNFDQMLGVVRREGQTVRLDGAIIGDAAFTPAGNGYEVARVAIGACSAGTTGACTHRLQGEFGMTMRGMDVLAGYALTAPAWSSCADAQGPGCIP